MQRTGEHVPSKLHLMKFFADCSIKMETFLWRWMLLIYSLHLDLHYLCRMKDTHLKQRAVLLHSFCWTYQTFGQLIYLDLSQTFWRTTQISTQSDAVPWVERRGQCSHSPWWLCTAPLESIALLLEAAVFCSCQLLGRQKVYQQPAEGKWTSAVPQSRPPAGLEDTSGNEAGTYYTLRKNREAPIVRQVVIHETNTTNSMLTVLTLTRKKETAHLTSYCCIRPTDLFF